MWPGASVGELYFACPEAKYFGVGKIDPDQMLGLSGSEKGYR